jgi:inosine/xanthosine triphosphatase
MEINLDSEQKIQDALITEEPNAIIAIIATKNPIKLNATKKAFAKFFPQTHSDISAESVPLDTVQPIGIEKVIEGAKSRAIQALNILKERRADMINVLDDFHKKWVFGIGIEAGLVEIPGSISGYLDFQYCVIIDLLGRMSMGAGPGWEYPLDITQKVVSENGALEISEVVKKMSNDENNKYENGAIGFFTKGLLDRPSLTQIAVQMALIPRISKDFYKMG